MSRLFFCLLIPLTLLASCATKRIDYPVDSVLNPVTGMQWEDYKSGVQLSRISMDEGPIRGWAVRIDLEHPELEILVTPGNSDGGGEVRGSYTTSFLRQHGLDLAINASPFYPVTLAPDTPQWVAGLAVADSEIYSSGDSDFAALLFSPIETGGYQASIQSPPFDLGGVSDAAGGFYQVLEDGRITAPEVTQRHPMTLAGLNTAGDVLYLLVIDGRQTGWSVGLTPLEGAHWLQHLGATDGMYFDGGGSSTLVIRDEEGEAELLNRPVDARFIWKQRVVANHLGFRVGNSE